MKRFSLLAAGVIALGLVSSPVLALSFRTFVSGTGSDANPCSLSAPCRTFARALTQTTPSGEIIVLSSADYGAVNITQSVSITNTSNFAGVTAGGGRNGITINTKANDSVTLRGLTIDGAGTGLNGIFFNVGGNLTVDQCNVMNFVGNGGSGNGILIQPTAGIHKIIITNTTVSNNEDNGVYYHPPFGDAITGFVIDRVSAYNNGNGIVFDNITPSGTAKASISNSIASFNEGVGFLFRGVTASLDASNASSNDGGGITVSSGTLALGRSVLMNNTNHGLYVFSSTVNSYNDNRIAGNGSGPLGGGAISAATLY